MDMAACYTKAVLAALGVLSVCSASSSSGSGASGKAGGEAEWAEPWDGAVFRPPAALGAVGMTRGLGSPPPGNAETVDLPVLLWWSPGLFPHFPGDSERIECALGACVASRDRRARADPRTRALIFYGTDFRAADAPLPRLAHQSWALLHEESPLNNFLLSHGPGIRLFNLTATFSRHSDYPLPTTYLWDSFPRTWLLTFFFFFLSPCRCLYVSASLCLSDSPPLQKSLPLERSVAPRVFFSHHLISQHGHRANKWVQPAVSGIGKGPAHPF